MMLARILFKVAVGALVGGILGAFFTGADPTYTIVWAGAIPAVILLGLFAGSGRVAGAAPLALARVETAQRGATTADGRQEITLRLVVAPPHSAAYTTTTKHTITTDEMWLYNSGSVLVVERPSDRGPEVRVVTSPPPEWAARADKARADPSLIPVASAAPVWEPATTTAPAAPRPGGAGLLGGLRGNAAFSLLIVVVSVAVVLIPAYSSIGRTVSNIAAGRPDGSNMVTGIHQQEAVDAIAAVAGSYQFTDIGFYDSYVLVDGLTAPGATTTDSYMWRWGRAMRDGPSFIQSSELQSELFDASGLDFSIIGPLVAQAKADAKLDNIESVYVGVRRSSFDESSRAPEISILIDNAYYDARFTYDFDGNELSRDGSAFER